MTRIQIVHLYPNEMNTYGDRGNLLTLVKRAEWHGLEVSISYYRSGDAFPSEADLVLGGGGQDSGQAEIQVDMQRIGDTIYKLVENNVPMLMVCGTYQLFGSRFITSGGQEIQGIGIFDVETLGGGQRMIGNMAIRTEAFGTLYGFENHSGQTTLGKNQQPLGTVVHGNGNNGQDKTEGARIHNAIGTYLHGPLLPNNPQFADWLIVTALQRRGIDFELQKLDDKLAEQSRQNAVKRPY